MFLYIIRYCLNHSSYYYSISTTTEVLTSSSVVLTEYLQALNVSKNTVKLQCLLSSSTQPLMSLQLFNERLMGAEGTKMDEDFQKMEKVRV